MDLSYYETLLGGAGESTSAGGGIWVVAPEGAHDEGSLRLIGKARVVADALGAYVHVLAGCSDGGDSHADAIGAGADEVWTAHGIPALADLTTFFAGRAPRAVLFPHTRAGRQLAGGLAHALGGSLCGRATDLRVDPSLNQIEALLPLPYEGARRVVAMLRTPAVVAVETGGLPPVFQEPWRTGTVAALDLSWPEPVHFPAVAVPGRARTLEDAPVVVAGGLGVRDVDGFAAVRAVASALGGEVAGDLAALDMGWIGPEGFVGITGHTVAPRLYLAFGIDGDSGHFAAIRDAGLIVAVQPDPAAPIVALADYNILADPVAVARALGLTTETRP